MSNANQFLHQFLKNGEFDYDFGLAVFSNYCANRSLLATLQRKRNKWNEEKLQYELKKLSEHIKEPVSVVKVETVVKPNVSTQKPPEKHPFRVPAQIDQLPDGITEKLQERRRLLYRKRGHIHGQLHNAKTDTERYELAKTIMSIRKEIDDIHDEMERVKNGEMPSADTNKELSAADYVKIRNLRMYIARTQKKLDNVKTVADKEKYTALLAKHQTELDKLK